MTVAESQLFCCSRWWWTTTTTLFAISVSAAGLAILPADLRPILAPAAALVTLQVFFIMVLWARESIFPLFDAGAIAVLATTVYGVIPLAGFATMNGVWDRYADGRLQAYDFRPSTIGHVGWMYVLYDATFITVYLAVRRTSVQQSPPVRMPSLATVLALAGLLIFGELTKFTLGIAYGFGTDSVYTQAAGVPAIPAPMPGVIRQLASPIFTAVLLVKQALLALLLINWRLRACRIALFAWLIAEIAWFAHRVGSRAPLLLLVISAALLYHRLVRPLRIRFVVAGGAALLAAFLGAGVLRTFHAQPAREHLNYLATMNEFQSIYTNAFDLYMRKEAGGLAAVPWQIHAVDLYLLIPHQLLPFEKLDPAIWYLGVIGQGDAPVGYVFGVIAQAIVGLESAEIVARASLLAIVLALLHRWYRRHDDGFWATLFYLFIAVWTYYSFRATTFWFLHFILYEFVPVMLCAKLADFALTSLSETGAVRCE